MRQQERPEYLSLTGGYFIMDFSKSHPGFAQRMRTRLVTVDIGDSSMKGAGTAVEP